MHSSILLLGFSLASHIHVQDQSPIKVSSAFLKSAQDCIELCSIHRCDIWLLDSKDRECFVMEELNRQQVFTYKQVLQNVLDAGLQGYEARKESAKHTRWMVGSFAQDRHWWQNIHHFDDANSLKQLLTRIRDNASSKYHRDQMKPNTVYSAIKTERSRISKKKSTVLVYDEEGCEKQCTSTDGCNWFYFCRERKGDKMAHCYMFDSNPYRHRQIPQCSGRQRYNSVNK